MFFLSDIELATRQDLFDPPGFTPRWQQSDIDRAIEKAVERYTQYYPNIAFSDMQSQQFQRTYSYPVPWNAAYPVLWIERILYPLQTYGSAFAPASAGPTATKTAGTALGIGVYQYAVTWLTQGGESTPSPLSSVATSSGSQNVALSNIPIGPSYTQVPSIATNSVIGRNLYRSQVGGTTLYLLATLMDNTTQTYNDSATDVSISTQPQPPTVNTSGVMFWPPFERDFSEFSNLFDSTEALAAGGNMGRAGAIGAQSSNVGALQQSFTLKLSSAELPQDSTQVLRVFYATKHQLDTSGTTIPDIHRDIIVLGAAAYAMEAFQVPTNDNFHFQDGALRDMVDDTEIPKNWLASSQNKMQQFVTRLEEIKRQRDYAYSGRVHWGDIPARWPRL